MYPSSKRNESRTKKASLNVVASAVDYGARVVVELALNPLLVTTLGNYLYGLWRILWRLAGGIEAAGGRSAQALKWVVAKEQTFTNFDEKRRYVGGAVAIWFLSLPIVSILGALLSWLLPRFLDVPQGLLGSVRLAIGLLITNVIVLGLTGIPRAILQGENLGYKRMGLSAVTVFVGGILTALSLYFIPGLVGVAAATVATTILAGLLFLQITRKYVPWFGIMRPTFEGVRWFFRLSWWFVVWKLVMASMMAGDVLVLGVFDSVEVVTIYSLTKFAPETLVKLVAIVVFGISPGLSGIIGAGDLGKAIRVRNEIMSCTWLLITVAGAVILLCNQVFVHFWIGPGYYAGAIPGLLIVIMVAQITFIRNEANMMDLTLNVRPKALIGLFSETVALVLAAFFVGYFEASITGLCVGLIIGRTLESVAYPWLVGRMLGLSWLAQLKGALRPMFISSLLFFLMLLCGDFARVASSWSTLFLAVMITVTFGSALAFYGGLSNNQRRILLQRLRVVTRG